MALRLVFFGTPAFAVPSLEALAAGPHPIVAVVTQPDRPRGRGLKTRGSPVKEAAARLGLTTIQPVSVRDAAFVDDLRRLEPDLGVVVAYGKILPDAVLAAPGRGLINLHASLLPRWRGAAPIHRAIMAGDRETGVTIMRVVSALDAGPMLAAVREPIGPDDTSVDLEARLAAAGARLLARTVDRLAQGPVEEVAQDASRAVYAPRLDRGDGRIDFTRPAGEIHNAIRGLQPWPLAAAVLHGRRLALLRSEPGPDEGGGPPPGTIVRIEPGGLVVATGRGTLRILRVQLEGKPAVAVRDFLNGHPTRAGDRFDPLPSAAP